MQKSFKRGFTLIELLVVIAIIGILASVVLVSLNSARGRGQDAAVKANLNGIRTQAELFYDSQNPPVYTGVCASVSDAMGAAASAGGGDSDCNDAAGAWAAQVQLRDTSYWCVDSTGTAATSSTQIGASATVCP